MLAALCAPLSGHPFIAGFALCLALELLVVIAAALCVRARWGLPRGPR